MVRFNNPLDDVKVAAPCPANWDEMIGCEQVRFCSQCSLNVYNLSGMSKKEAESIIARTEGRLCVRFYRRADGTILTNNCPVGLRAIRRRLSRITTAIISAVLSFFAGLGIYAGWSQNERLNDRAVMGTRIQERSSEIVETTIQEPETLSEVGQLHVTYAESHETIRKTSRKKIRR